MPSKTRKPKTPAFDPASIFASPARARELLDAVTGETSGAVSEPHPFARPTSTQREGQATENASASGGNEPFTPPTPRFDPAPLLREIRERSVGDPSNLRILDVDIVGEGDAAYALVTVEVVMSLDPGSGMSMILNALYGYENGLVPLDDKRENKAHLEAAYAVRRIYSVGAAKLVLRVPRDGNFTIERRIGDS
jgi:hypothetical protein